MSDAMGSLFTDGEVTKCREGKKRPKDPSKICQHHQSGGICRAHEQGKCPFRHEGGTRNTAETARHGYWNEAQQTRDEVIWEIGQGNAKIPRVKDWKDNILLGYWRPKWRLDEDEGWIETDQVEHRKWFFGAGAHAGHAPSPSKCERCEFEYGTVGCLAKVAGPHFNKLMEPVSPIADQAKARMWTQGTQNKEYEQKCMRELRDRLGTGENEKE
jgi:hypothetical protein